MPSPNVSNLVRFYALVLLLERKHHGYELMKEIGHRLDKKISAGQMYPFLAELEQNKLVRASAAGVREKTAYELSPEGKKFAQSMISRFGGLLEIALKPHLTVCTHCGCKVFDGGVVEKINDRDLKFCCSHCAASYKGESHRAHHH